MKKILLLFAFLMCTAKVADAQDIDSIVNRAAKAYFTNGQRIGVSIGVIQKGKIHQYHYGSTQKGKIVKANNETIYEIGSITKTFTGMLLAQAVRDKKVGLNDDIRKYLKGDYPNLEYKGKPIQLLHLANLTSGLPDNLPEKMPPFKAAGRDSQLFELKKIHDEYSRSQFLTDLHQVQLVREPGLNPSHSNTAAELLGFLLENIYGLSYDALLIRYITGPLTMKNTFVSVPASKEKQRAKGYNEKGTLMPEIPKDAAGAGVLQSTLPDMIRYANYHLTGKDDRVLLSHNLSWGDLDNSGIGLSWWLKTNFDGKRKIWTSGGTFGFSSYCVLYPESGFGVVALANENDGGAEDALSGIASAIYNEVYFSATQRASLGFGFSKSINILLVELNKPGFQSAAESVNDLKKKDDSFKLSEGELNNFGYYLLNKASKDKALEIFKLNTILFPGSSNTFDSLAETYESIGDKDSAIKNYKRALELDPGNSNSAEHLKKLEN
ncbi:serine hydrolase [Dyadobacter frigoris]|uniref:Serine hydrolase n=1 Tax=Dyadobacter frigoris TaxID=2576211 RepID=A0A4U6CY76_9BACT|nr:serine hydrolase [Dyadobacter frigoris]TKT89286.1 serine hydrolase [Dyadobacter frigoris]